MMKVISARLGFLDFQQAECDRRDRRAREIPLMSYTSSNKAAACPSAKHPCMRAVDITLAPLYIVGAASVGSPKPRAARGITPCSHLNYSRRTP